MIDDPYAPYLQSLVGRGRIVPTTNILGNYGEQNLANVVPTAPTAMGVMPGDQPGYNTPKLPGAVVQPHKLPGEYSTTQKLLNALFGSTFGIGA